MNVKLRNGTLFIELDVHDAKASASGKTFGVAGTQGRFQSSVTIDGQPVWVIANAFVYPKTRQTERDADEPPRKTRTAAAKQTSTKKKLVVDEDDEEEYEHTEQDN